MPRHSLILAGQVAVVLLITGGILGVLVDSCNVQNKEETIAEQTRKNEAALRKKMADQKYDAVTEDVAKEFPEGPWRLLYLNCRHIAHYHGRWINKTGVGDFLKAADPPALTKLKMWQAEVLLDLTLCSDRTDCMILLTPYVMGEKEHSSIAKRE